MNENAFVVGINPLVTDLVGPKGAFLPEIEVSSDGELALVELWTEWTATRLTAEASQAIRRFLDKYTRSLRGAPVAPKSAIKSLREANHGAAIGHEFVSFRVLPQHAGDMAVRLWMFAVCPDSRTTDDWSPAAAKKLDRIKARSWSYAKSQYPAFADDPLGTLSDWKAGRAVDRVQAS